MGMTKMNKKAFTLVELLAVIIILSIITTMVTLSVSSYMKEAREQSFDALVNLIESSTELYLAENSANYPQLEVAGSTFYIELNDLVTSKYIKANIIDERTQQPIPLTTKVYAKVINKSKIEVDFRYE